jgi:hypothetical protein
MEQSQQESCPIYEIIMTISETTARIPTTDACPVKNTAYETSSKKITTQTNEAYGVFTSKNIVG